MNDIIQVGDKIVFTTELLEQIHRNPHHRSQTVKILKIEEETDGTKMVWVGNVNP